MENRMSSTGKVIFALLVLSFLGLILVTIGGGIWLHSLTTNPPNITILMPKDRPVLTSGQMLEIYTESNAEAGIERIDFIIDGEEKADLSLLAEGKTELFADFPWRASQTGIHKIQLVVHDRNGRVSEPAELIVGVIPLDTSADNVERMTIEIPQEDQNPPPEQDGGSAGDSGSGELPVEALEPAGPPPLQVAQLNDAAQQQVQQEVNNADVDQDFPQDIQGFAEDLPPTIMANSSIEVLPIGVAFSVSIQAIDDIGVAQVYLNIFEVFGDSLENFPLFIPSDQDESFALDSGYLFSDPGHYVFEIYAIDTSGQHSEVLFFPVQVLESDLEGGPAVVVEDQAEAGPQDCGEPFNPIQIPGLPEGFAEGVCDPGGNQQQQPIADDNGCLKIFPSQTPLGINLDMMALCPFQGQSGQQVFFEYQRSIADSDQQLPDPLVHYPPVAKINAGETYTYLERSPTCWSEYNFDAGISYLAEGTEDDGIFNPNQSQAQASFLSLPCNQPDMDGPVEFIIEDIEIGYGISWTVTDQDTLLGNHALSDLQFRLDRYKLETNQIKSLLDDVVPGNQIGNLTGWSVDEGLFCGEPVYYRLRLIHQSTGEMLFDQTLLAPQKECLEGGVRDFGFFITQEYFVWGDLPVRFIQGIDITIPPGWPYMEDVNLLLLRMPGGMGAFNIDADARRNGKHYQMGIGSPLDCGTEPQPFYLQVARGNIDGLSQFYSDQNSPQFDVVDQGKTLMVRPLFCLPAPPTNLQLHATMCDGSPCIQLNWMPPNYTEGKRYYYPDNLVLVKQTFAENLQAQDEISLPVDQVGYNDKNVFPDIDMVYKLYYEFGGIHIGETQMTIHTPGSDIWNCDVSSLDEHVCE